MIMCKADVGINKHFLKLQYMHKEYICLLVILSSLEDLSVIWLLL
jgi:hypothetical protein